MQYSKFYFSEEKNTYRRDNSCKFCKVLFKKIEPNRIYNEFLSKIKLVLDTIQKKQH